MIPSDVFVQLTVSLAKQSDAFLLLVQRVCRAVEQHGDDKLLDDVTVIVQVLNSHTEDIRETLRAVVEEHRTEARDG